MGFNITTIAEESTSQDHIVIFPFMAKGHTIPLLHLSTALSQRGLEVTFITTPSNSPFISQALLPNPNIKLLEIPFPKLPPLPDGCESTDHLPSPDLYPCFLQATALLKNPFHQALQGMSQRKNLPICVIADFFLGWTLPICQHFGVPRLASHGMGCFAMTLCKALWVHQTHLSVTSNGETFHLPGTPNTIRLTRADVPNMILHADTSDPVFQMLAECGEADVNSWGLLVNSFSELENDYMARLMSFYREGVRAWLVGPLCLYNPRLDGELEISMQWLEGKARGSVVYVSFGTQTYVSEAQLDEVAFGLDMCGYEYVFVARSDMWVPPPGVMAKDEGLLVRGWAPQRNILAHEAIGGFVSHCGWNSVLESLAAEVPILTWPMMAEQPLNAKYVVEELGMGLRLAAAGLGSDGVGLVGRKEICDGVKELMEGEKGKMVRKKAEELGRMAKGAVEEGGSSHMSLTKLIEELNQSHKVAHRTGPPPLLSPLLSNQSDYKQVNNLVY